jgi:hypothetical protein
MPFFADHTAADAATERFMAKVRYPAPVTSEQAENAAKLLRGVFKRAYLEGVAYGRAHP